MCHTEECHRAPNGMKDLSCNTKHLLRHQDCGSNCSRGRNWGNYLECGCGYGDLAHPTSYTFCLSSSQRWCPGSHSGRPGLHKRVDLPSVVSA